MLCSPEFPHWVRTWRVCAIWGKCGSAEWRREPLPARLLRPTADASADHQGGNIYNDPTNTYVLKYPQCYVCQITRSHYQNAVTATRMDTSPQTPDVDAHLTGGNGLSGAAAGSRHTTTTLVPPPREPSRPSSARSRPQQSCVAHSTSLLNEKNRIVRGYLQTKPDVTSHSGLSFLLLFYHVKRRQQVL